MKKVMFISSTGGHLEELLRLKSLFIDYDYSLVTEKTKSNLSLKDKYKNVSFLCYGTKDHLFSYLFKFIFNCFKSIGLYFKYHPKYIVTTGTHTAVPMCYIGKLFRSKIIDVSVDTLTIELTGDESKITALIKLMEEYGIQELVRTGVTALERGDKNIRNH